MKKTKFVCGLTLSALVLTSCGAKTYQPQDYMMEMNWKNDFKILQLSDIHLANKDEQDRQFDFMEETILEADKNNDLDLIIITGDIFTFADKITANRLFNFLDKFEVPWTLTFGNHDEQCYFSIDWLTGELNKRTKNNTNGKNFTYFRDLQDDDVFGNANFAINLMENNKVHTQLIIMDSNRYNFGEYLGYDYIKENQIEWYKQITDKTKEMNGGSEYATSLLFFHIPLPEFETAWNLYQEGSSEVKFLIDGAVAQEGVSCPDYNSGFFDVLKDRGSKGVFVGHDHVNDWAIEYQGVTLSYCVTSTDRIYCDFDMMGGTTITIHDDNTFEIGQIFHSYKEA